MVGFQAFRLSRHSITRRNTMKRFTAFFFALTILLAAAAQAPARDDKKALTAAEIIDKHLAAIGGKEALAKFKSRVAIGTARKENDTATPLAIVSEAPNRVSAIYQFQDFSWQLTYDGSKPIFRPVLTRANAPVLRKYEAMLSSGTMFNGVSLYNALLDGEASEFKEVDGVKLPFRLEVVATAPLLRRANVGTIVATISEYRHNVQIDPKMFQ